MRNVITAPRDNNLVGAVAMFGAVFAACLFGISTRPMEFLANIWPANAMMLGMLLRGPGRAGLLNWFAGGAAFVAADLLTGAPVVKTLLVNGTNLVSVGGAYAVLHRLPPDILALRQTVSIAWLGLAAGLGGMLAGLLGGLLNPYLFNGSAQDGLTFWWATEVANYIALLPVLLSAPPLTSLRARVLNAPMVRRGDLMPALAALVSCVLAIMIGGPGAVALPVLALLWCGLVYPVFPTTLLALVFSLVALDFFAGGSQEIAALAADKQMLMSFRLGVAAITLMPVALSIVTRSRDELTERLRIMADHDALTGALNHGRFHDAIMASVPVRGRGMALILLDMDHFKSVNDAHGHAAGDEVLREAVRRIRASLRQKDSLGRLGGEEFGVLLLDLDQEEAFAIAERIRLSLSSSPIRLPDDTERPVTASLGLCIVPPRQMADADQLLNQADQALYSAKHAGRNRVSIQPPLSEPETKTPAPEARAFP